MKVKASGVFLQNFTLSLLNLTNVWALRGRRSKSQNFTYFMKAAFGVLQIIPFLIDNKCFHSQTIIFFKSPTCNFHPISDAKVLIKN